MLGGKVAQGEVAQGTALRRPRRLNFYGTRNFPPPARVFPPSTLWMMEQLSEAQVTERIPIVLSIRPKAATRQPVSYLW